MSHNSKYYVKRLTKSKFAGCKSLVEFGFSRASSQPVLTEETSVESSTSVSFSCQSQENSCVTPVEFVPECVPLEQPSLSQSQATVSCCDDQNTSSSVTQLDPGKGFESEVYVASKLELQQSTLVPLTKKQMTIDAKYETAFDWLYYSCSKSGYLCKVCELFGLSSTRGSVSPFLEGTELGDHPVRKLERHEQSSVHVESLSKYIKVKQGGTDLTVPHMFTKKTANDQDEIVRNRKFMSTLISTLNLVVHNLWPLDSVAELIDHMAQANCRDITNYMKYHKSTMYTSSTSVTEVLTAMNSYFEDTLLSKIRASDFVALLADESTDESNRTQFAILIRFLDSNGIIDDHFVGIINVKKGDAATLTEAIETFLQSKEIDISKVMFVGFDGCNTMSGVQNGVQRRFRHIVPHSLYINCRSHRLALCVKHLMKDFKVLEDVDAVLLAMYYLFENSPQKFAVFKDVQSSYAVKELVMVRAAATRWLSHGVACTRFIDRFVQIVDTLDELIERKKEPETIGLRDMVTNKNTLAAILVLCDILNPVNIFCKYLQGTALDFSAVTLKLKELTDTLHILIERFRASLHTQQDGLYVAKMSAIFEEVDERTVYARRLRNGNVLTPHQLIEELAVPMVHKLIQELEDGFNFMSPVLKAFSVLSLSRLPDTIVELADYGKNAIETLASHYGLMKEDTYSGQRSQSPPLFNKATALAEFDGFKYVMFMNRYQNSNPSVDMLQKFLEDDILKATYPSMYKLVLLSRLIPTSTASVERIFSLMNNICTSNRNRLSQHTLKALMLLRREGVRVLTEEQKHQIIDNFKRAKNRDIAL